MQAITIPKQNMSFFGNDTESELAMHKSIGTCLSVDMLKEGRALLATGVQQKCLLCFGMVIYIKFKHYAIIIINKLGIK